MIRDPVFWSRYLLTIGAKDFRAWQIQMHIRLREAVNSDEVERLRDDNAVLIYRLDRSTKEDVIGALARREKELRTNA